MNGLAALKLQLKTSRNGARGEMLPLPVDFAEFLHLCGQKGDRHYGELCG